MTADYVYTDHPNSPYREPPSAERMELERRARDVADRHFRAVSPEFVSWIEGRVSDNDVGKLLSATLPPVRKYLRLEARVVALNTYNAWLKYAATIPRELAVEIAREP